MKGTAEAPGASPGCLRAAARSRGEPGCQMRTAKPRPRFESCFFPLGEKNLSPSVQPKTRVPESSATCYSPETERGSGIPTKFSATRWPLHPLTPLAEREMLTTLE